MTVEVTQGPITKNATLDITIRHEPLDQISLAPETVVLAIGETQEFGVEVVDAYGNPVPEAQITWEVVEEAGTIGDDGLLTTGTRANTFTEGVKVIASLNDVSLEASASVTVNPGPPASLSLPPLEISAGAAQQLAAFVADQYDNALEKAQVTWAVNDANAGSISPSGLFTAGEVSGVFEAAIEAQAVEVDLKAATSVDIIPGPLAQVVIAPDPVEIGMGMKQQFVAVGADEYGNRVLGLDLTWSVEEGGGKIDASGFFTAGSAPGTYNKTVKAAAIQGEVTSSDTASVNVEPDRIIFVSDRNGGQSDIYTMNADGSDILRLTAVEAYSAVWSPSGRRIFYQSYESGGIVAINDDGSWPVLLAPDFYGDTGAQFTLHPSISPDGGHILIEIWTVPYLQSGEYDFDDSSTDIFRIDRDGGNVTRLTNTADGNEFVPSWSPDGSKIVYDFTPEGGQTGEGDIWVMDADGSNQKRLASSPGNDSHPSYSPDGKQILFASTWDGDAEIYVMNANGGNARKLTSNDASDWTPACSASGSRIVFSSDRDGNDEIYVMDRNGGNQKRLTNDRGADEYPKWAPRKRGVEVNQASVVFPKASVLEELAVQAVTSRVSAAVVRIETDQGAGSGFIFDADGLLLTNNHVISGAEQITVYLEDGTRFPGTVKGRDLAVVEIDATDLPWLA